MSLKKSVGYGSRPCTEQSASANYFVHAKLLQVAISKHDFDERP